MVRRRGATDRHPPRYQHWLTKLAQQMMQASAGNNSRAKNDGYGDADHYTPDALGVIEGYVVSMAPLP